MDLHLTADGEIVLMHEHSVAHTTDGTGLVREMTLAEIKGLDAAYWFDPDGDESYPLRGQGIQVPTLREVFEAYPDMHYNVDVKEHEPEPWEHRLAELVQAYSMESKVCWGSANDESAQRLKALMPEVCIYFPTNAVVCFASKVMDGIDPMRECDTYDVLQIPEGAAWPEMIATAHANAIAIYVWTINDREMMELLFADGVDGIITDRLDLLREVIDNL